VSSLTTAYLNTEEEPCGSSFCFNFKIIRSLGNAVVFSARPISSESLIVLQL